MRVRIVSCATALALAVGLPTAMAKSATRHDEGSTETYWMCIEMKLSPWGICVPNLLDDLPLQAR